MNVGGPRDVVIRPAEPGDAPGIRRTHEASIRGLGVSAYTAAEAESWVGTLTDAFYRDGMAHGVSYRVAEAAGIGVVGFGAWKDDEVMAVYVAPGWERRGIGTRLLALAEAAIAAAGHRRIRIGASLSGREFYEARGYRVVLETTWTTRGGLEIATLDMEREP